MFIRTQSILELILAFKTYQVLLLIKYTQVKRNYPNVKILWASVREAYNIVQAESVNCDIITIPAAIFEKLNLLNKNLTLFSVETVKTFYEDAKTSKFKIN